MRTSCEISENHESVKTGVRCDAFGSKTYGRDTGHERVRLFVSAPYACAVLIALRCVLRASELAGQQGHYSEEDFRGVSDPNPTI